NLTRMSILFYHNKMLFQFMGRNKARRRKKTVRKN
ncbi:hypothetical protein Csa_023602, partial [Cucumis sativus]